MMKIFVAESGCVVDNYSLKGDHVTIYSTSKLDGHRADFRFRIDNTLRNFRFLGVKHENHQ